MPTKAPIAVQSESLFVLLPNINIWNQDRPGTSQSFMRTASKQLRASSRSSLSLSAVRSGLHIKLVDEVAPGDTALVIADAAQRVQLSLEEPGLRVATVKELSPMWLRRPTFLFTPLALLGLKQTLEVSVVDAATQKPLADVDVVGLVDRARRIGTSAKTNAKGIATLSLPANIAQLELVEAYAASGYWPSYALQVDLSVGSVGLACTPIDLAVQDVRGVLGFEGADDDGAGVKVAVVDTGVTKHPDLRITKGRNVVKGERETAYSDELGHGTHVAGIIAGRGKRGRGVRGVAPGVELYVYRVFGTGSQTALSFNIAKAIRKAVDDGCDLINMSLGGNSEVPEVLREIQRARALGVVCVAAAGNEDRSPVSYPARYSQVLAVSAFGRKDTWPPKAAQDLEVAQPFGTDPRNFIAAFSNIGSDIDLTGPGVGVVSTYPKGYAVMDGTSMASPAMTGALARQLARHPKILRMARDQKRSDAIVKLALTEAKVLGFGATFEGAGVLF